MQFFLFTHADSIFQSNFINIIVFMYLLSIFFTDFVEITIIDRMAIVFYLSHSENNGRFGDYSSAQNQNEEHEVRQQFRESCGEVEKCCVSLRACFQLGREYSKNVPPLNFLVRSGMGYIC